MMVPSLFGDFSGKNLSAMKTKNLFVAAMALTCGMAMSFGQSGQATKLWDYATGGAIVSSPAIGTNGTIYVGSDDKKLYAVNPDGTIRWTFLTGGAVQSSPMIGPDGRIYVGSNDKKLYSVNPENGTTNWV